MQFLQNNCTIIPCVFQEKSAKAQGIFAPFFKKGALTMAKLKKRKDGRYQKSVYIGLDENGKRKYKTICGRTIKEVEAAVAELKLKIGKGIDVSSNDTFGDWEKRWLTIQKNVQTEQHYKTLERYLKHFESLKFIKINKLTIADFQEIISELAARNPHTGKPTARKSLREFTATVNRVFEYAIENRAIDFNPVKYVKIPKSAPKQKDRRALTTEEQKLIINTPHRAQIPAMIMMLAGLRRGECLALQWADIDLKKGKINVDKTLVFDGNNSFIKRGAKTEAGNRSVDMPSVLIEFLKNQPKHTPFDYVVTTANGSIMTRSAWRRLWESYMAELNLVTYNNQNKIKNISGKRQSKFDPDGVPQVINKFTAHCLRHTHATNLFYAGYDVLYIQHQLGHTKPETTLNIYTHLKKEKENQISRLDSYLSVNQKIC